jgi:hypothetical protein
MKRTVDGRWAHLTCAMWVPGISTFTICFSSQLSNIPLIGVIFLNFRDMFCGC